MIIATRKKPEKRLTASIFVSSKNLFKYSLWTVNYFHNSIYFSRVIIFVNQSNFSFLSLLGKMLSPLWIIVHLRILDTILMWTNDLLFRTLLTEKTDIMTRFSLYKNSCDLLFRKVRIFFLDSSEFLSEDSDYFVLILKNLLDLSFKLLTILDLYFFLL